MKVPPSILKPEKLRNSERAQVADMQQKLTSAKHSKFHQGGIQLFQTGTETVLLSEETAVAKLRGKMGTILTPAPQRMILTACRRHSGKANP